MMNRENPQVNNAAPRVLWDNKRYIQLCVYVSLICNFFILWANPQGKDFFVSWATRILIIFNFMLAAIAFLNLIRSSHVKRMDVWFVVVIAITLICFLANCTSNLLGNVVSYMCFLMLPAYAVLYRQVGDTVNLRRAIYIANAAYMAIFVWLSFSDYSHIAYGEYGIKYVSELTLGYQNANETGIYLLISLVIMFCAALDAQKLRYRNLALMLTAALAYMLWQTRSRTCIVLAAAIILLKLLKVLPKLGRGIQTLVLLAPTIVLSIMLLLPNQIANLTFMGEVVDTGRYEMFVSFFNSINLGDILLGNFAKYPGTNMHNSALSLFAMFGLPATGIYLVFLKSVMNYYHSILRQPRNYLAFAGFLALIVHGVAEGTMLVSGAVYAGLCGLLFILMLPDREEVQA